MEKFSQFPTVLRMTRGRRSEILSNEVSDAKETFIIVVLVPVKINRYIIMARVSGENDK